MSPTLELVDGAPAPSGAANRANEPVRKVHRVPQRAERMRAENVTCGEPAFVTIQMPEPVSCKLGA